MESRHIVMAGGCCLAFGAAFTNLGLVFQTGTSVSHLTGDTVRLAADIGRLTPGQLTDAARVGVAALFFLIGASLAGFFIHHPNVDFSRPYGRTVTGIGFLFLTGHFLLKTQPLASIALAACGCGLQNALAAHYRGIVLRTTHLTGLFTDLGITIGMKLRGHEIPVWKITVPALLILSFFLGAIFAAIIHFHNGIDTMLLAGMGYILAGIGWSLNKRGYFRRSSS